MILQAVVGGFVLDALFGDPAWLPHPVVLMGRCISRLEKFLRTRLPGTPQGELLGGAVTAFCLPVGTFLVTSLVCLAAAKLSPWLGLAVQMFWCGQALAAKGLAQESTNVYNELVRNDLPAARKAVSRIVGRDTQNLTAEGVTKAAVETVFYEWLLEDLSEEEKQAFCETLDKLYWKSKRQRQAGFVDVARRIAEEGEECDER